jgi:NADPH:quinone reductase-like Zn-dependent oxidoreductase
MRAATLLPAQAALFTLLCVLLPTSAVAALPAKMRSVRAPPCAKPFTKCVKLQQVPLPKVGAGHALVAVNGSSVNPSDVDTVEGGGCIFGCGNDMAGTVVACEGCTHLKVGDEVWGFAHPAYSDYVATPESQAALKPRSLPMGEAGTIPEVGLTSLFSLKRTGSLPGTPMPPGVPPAWASKSNLTVLITAGSGGTGFIGEADRYAPREGVAEETGCLAWLACMP